MTLPDRKSPPPVRGRLGWGVMTERDAAATTLNRATIVCIETVAAPHPSLPLKGGGEETTRAIL
jgi:hypothetical protein